MKKIISICLIIAIVFSIIGCGNKSYKESPKDITQAETSDFETINTEPTDEEVTTTESAVETVEKEPSFLSYVGEWIDDEVNTDVGSAMLEISVEGSDMTIIFSLSSALDIPRFATFEVKTALEDIENNSITLSYDDDMWGNKGNIVLNFKEDYILCELKNVEPNSDTVPLWGTYNKMYLMCRYEEIYDDSENTENSDYETNTPETTYDISKASDILASLGLTEQGFRDNCTALQYVKNGYHTPSKVKIGENVYHFFDDGATILDMREYSENYINQKYKIALVVSDKEISDEGIPVYYSYLEYYIDYYNNGTIPIVIFDRRDNTKSPNVAIGDGIITYCVFTGCQTFDNGNDYLSFVMLSLDK